MLTTNSRTIDPNKVADGAGDAPAHGAGREALLSRPNGERVP
jgi:hypothetical protein